MAISGKGVRAEGVVRATGLRWERERDIPDRGGGGVGASVVKLSEPGGEGKEGRTERAQATIVWFLLGSGATGRF